MHSPFGGWHHHLSAPLGSVSLDSQSPAAPCESSSLATPQFGEAAKGKRLNGQARCPVRLPRNILLTIDRGARGCIVICIKKTFTPDFPTKKVVKNTGQVPSYFVEQSHPAIIDPVTFEMVQSEAARRKREGGRYSGVSIFSGKIKCGECGGFFGAKVWHSTDKYRRVIYRCNNKYDGHKCQTPHG
jgi:hypothetical protein